MPIRMLFIYAIGFLAQFFFSARVAIQWIMSERQRRVVTPTLYWLFSLLGSLLMIVYGLFRNDFSILIAYGITRRKLVERASLDSHLPKIIKQELLDLLSVLFLCLSNCFAHITTPKHHSDQRLHPDS